MDNLYQTPSAELIIEERPRDMFFVTSLNKLFTLYFVTLGLYSIYWVYKQWDTQRAAMRPKRISPAARSIFQIFFIHSLCRLIAKQLQAKGLEEMEVRERSVDVHCPDLRQQRAFACRQPPRRAT